MIFIKNNLKSFKSFLDSHNLNPIWGERSFSIDSYGGTIDLYCELEGKKTIIDFKTSKKILFISFYSIRSIYTIIRK